MATSTKLPYYPRLYKVKTQIYNNTCKQLMIKIDIHYAKYQPI